MLTKQPLAVVVLVALWTLAGDARAEPAVSGSAAAAEGPLCPAHCLARDEPSEDEPARAGERVDLNHADEHTLLDLPGIGPARARAILSYRQTHGAFRNISQLLQIKGIGRALLRQLRPLITL